jgi:DNA-binding response OmpR family regulator
MRIGLLGSFTLNPAQEWLRAAGHELERLGASVELACASCKPNAELLLVDLKPSSDAYAALRRLRTQLGPSFPIVAILPDDREEDVVAALRNGADDCVAIPLRREEFLVRVTVTGRWRFGSAKGGRVEIGCFSIDVAERKLWRHGACVALTEKDFDVAVLLLSNAGRVFSRDYIAAAIWGEGTAPSSRTIDTHVYRVRSKLHLREAEGWRLEAIYGKGYRLMPLDPGTHRADAGKRAGAHAADFAPQRSQPAARRSAQSRPAHNASGRSAAQD